MTEEEVLTKLEEAYAREYTPEQRRLFIVRLSKYSYVQLTQLFNTVASVSKRLPILADLIGCAIDLGFDAKQYKRRRAHSWQKSDCPLCEGEGILSAFFDFVLEQQWETGKRRKYAILKVLVRASSEKAMERPGEYEFNYRCSCPAGRSMTLSKIWPIWNNPKLIRTEEGQFEIEYKSKAPGNEMCGVI